MPRSMKKNISLLFHPVLLKYIVQKIIIEIGWAVWIKINLEGQFYCPGVYVVSPGLPKCCVSIFFGLTFQPPSNSESILVLSGSWFLTFRTQISWTSNLLNVSTYFIRSQSLLQMCKKGSRPSFNLLCLWPRIETIFQQKIGTLRFTINHSSFVMQTVQQFNSNIL